MAEERLEYLLKEWGLPATVIQQFTEAGLTSSLLPDISDEILKVPLEDNVELLIKFKVKRGKWVASKTAINAPAVVPPKPFNDLNGEIPRVLLVDDSDSSPNNSMQINDVPALSTPSHLIDNGGERSKQVCEVEENTKEAPKKRQRTNQNYLEGLLSKSKKGRDVLAHFKINLALENKFQTFLVETIIEEEQRENSMVKIPIERFNDLADMITDLFPGECKKEYISVVHHADGSSTYGGKLYRRYYNERRKSKMLGMGAKPMVAAVILILTDGLQGKTVTRMDLCTFL